MKKVMFVVALVLSTFGLGVAANGNASAAGCSAYINGNRAVGSCSGVSSTYMRVQALCGGATITSDWVPIRGLITVVYTPVCNKVLSSPSVRLA